MSQFKSSNIKIININYHISNEWKKTDKFDKFLKKETASDGHQYCIIDKRIREFSRLERFARGCLGVVAVICTLGGSLHFKSVQDLFKSKEKKYFAIKCDDQSLKNASATLKKNKYAVSRTVSQDISELQNADESLRADENFIKSLIRKKPGTLRYISDKLKTNDDFLNQIKKEFPEEFWNTKEPFIKNFIQKQITKDPSVWENAPDYTKKDPYWAMAAIEMNLKALQFADASLTKNSTFINNLLLSFPAALSYVNPDMKTSGFISNLISQKQRVIFKYEQENELLLFTEWTQTLLSAAQSENEKKAIVNKYLQEIKALSDDLIKNLPENLIKNLTFLNQIKEEFPKEFWNTKGPLIKKFIQKQITDNFSVWENASDYTKKDPYWAMAAIEMNLKALQFADASLTKNSTFINNLLLSCPAALSYVNPDMKPPGFISNLIPQKQRALENEALLFIEWIQTLLSAAQSENEKKAIVNKYLQEIKNLPKNLTFLNQIKEEFPKEFWSTKEPFIKNFIQNQIKENLSVWENAPDDTKEDPYWAMAAIEMNPKALEFAGASLTKSSTFINNLLLSCPAALSHINSNLQNDLNFIFELISAKQQTSPILAENTQSLEFSKWIKTLLCCITDENLIKEIIQKYPQELKSIPDSLKTDNDFLNQIKEKFPKEFWSTKEPFIKNFIQNQIKENLLVWENTPDDTKKDLYWIAAVGEINPQELPRNVKNTKDLDTAHTLLLNAPNLLPYIDLSLRKDLDFICDLTSKKQQTLSMLPENTQSLEFSKWIKTLISCITDENLIKIIIKQYPQELKSIPDSLKKNYPFLYGILKNSEEIFINSEEDFAISFIEKFTGSNIGRNPGEITDLIMEIDQNYAKFDDLYQWIDEILQDTVNSNNSNNPKELVIQFYKNLTESIKAFPSEKKLDRISFFLTEKESFDTILSQLTKNALTISTKNEKINFTEKEINKIKKLFFGSKFKLFILNTCPITIKALDHIFPLLASSCIYSESEYFDMISFLLYKLTDYRLKLSNQLLNTTKDSDNKSLKWISTELKELLNLLNKFEINNIKIGTKETYIDVLDPLFIDPDYAYNKKEKEDQLSDNNIENTINKYNRQKTIDTHHKNTIDLLKKYTAFFNIYEYKDSKLDLNHLEKFLQENYKLIGGIKKEHKLFSPLQKIFKSKITTYYVNHQETISKKGISLKLLSKLKTAYDQLAKCLDLEELELTRQDGRSLDDDKNDEKEALTMQLLLNLNYSDEIIEGMTIEDKKAILGDQYPE